MHVGYSGAINVSFHLQRSPLATTKIIANINVKSIERRLCGCDLLKGHTDCDTWGYVLAMCY